MRRLVLAGLALVAGWGVGAGQAGAQTFEAPDTEFAVPLEAPATPDEVFTAPSAAVVPPPRPRPEGAEPALSTGAGPDVAAAAEPLPTLPAPDVVFPDFGAADTEPLPLTLSSDTDELPAVPEEPVAGTSDDLAGSPDELPPLPSAEPGPTETAAVEPPPVTSPIEPDLAYGAFQRGYYLTAFDIAIGRAEAGDVAAQTLIALIYENGYGVPQDFAKAVEWYSLAADAGDREAQFALGMMLMQGRGVAQDRNRGADYIEQAANQGQVDAMYNLGLLLLEGSLRQTDPRRAAQLLAAAAESGSPDAQYAMGQLYSAGVGVAKDESRALQWYASAARMGIVAAQVDYAIRLFNGIGVTKDPSAAAAWFERAAEAGDPIAQNRLARILAIGVGSAANPVEAAKWHFIARNGGKDDEWLDNYVAGLSPEQRQAALDAAQRWPAGG